MKIILTPAEKQALDERHKKEHDRRIADRIKAVLLHSEGWSQLQIFQALRIRPETVHDHLEAFKRTRKLKPENGGSEGYLNEVQTRELIAHLEEHTYVKVCDICSYVYEKYQIEFTVRGMTSWLHRHKFSYKKPKGIPAKSDPEKQAAFIKEYERLLNTIPEDEPIEFGDGVHPTMATKVAYGWIRTGVDKPIATIASRIRLNLMGSINLESMEVTFGSYETLNSASMTEHFKALRQKYQKAPKIHLFLDQGSYNTSFETRDAAEKHGIILHHLPPYSPNLNPIERLWKVMNERVRNNRVFRSAKEFRQEIMDFFKITWPQIAMSMTGRINDNFQILKQAS
jgi:transposase